MPPEEMSLISVEADLGRGSQDKANKANILPDYLLLVCTVDYSH